MAAIVTSPAACSAAAAVDDPRGPDALEDIGDRPRGRVRGAAPEVLERRLVRERRPRPQDRDRQRPLERPAPRKNFTPDRTDRRRRQRTAVGGRQTGDDLSLSVGGIRRQILPSLEVSDLEGGLGSLVEEVEDLVV